MWTGIQDLRSPARLNGKISMGLLFLKYMNGTFLRTGAIGHVHQQPGSGQRAMAFEARVTVRHLCIQGQSGMLTVSCISVVDDAIAFRYE